ncbi:hypothetical protein SADUNF_Sadunf15G0017300 [Salix dunnii]|uniref:SBP-type domain-containing protein n=1 Tax=Salix dunnii TaxID=1413687 RepID=A0A835JEN0_9ROSI|nr:hypothetical protein SADUNF_Sadunf15G0017300 [Salix dunnii]
MKVPQEKQDSAEETRLPAPASWNHLRREHNDTPRASVVGSSSVKVPSCRVDGCPVSLSSFRRRHRVCEMHCKAPTVIVQGLAQRFCQTCHRFHVMSEFDGKKRSCRKTLAERIEKRRKGFQDFVSRNASKSSAILPDPPAPNSNPDFGTLPDPPQPRCTVHVILTSIFLPRTLNQKKNPNARRSQYQA